LRDQPCLLIREHNLDATLVKAYAADFCGTQTLSGASPDLVESFISNLSASAKQNRDALICKHNSYSRPQEARPCLTGEEAEPWEIIHFKLYKSQMPVVEKAVETAALMLGSDKSGGIAWR